MCDAGFVDFGGNVEFYVTLGVEYKMEKHLFFGHVGRAFAIAIVFS